MSLALRNLALYVEPATGDAAVSATAGTLSLNATAHAAGVGHAVAAIPATMGLGKAWTPDLLPGSELIAWLAADRNAVQTHGAELAEWTDASPNGNDATTVEIASTSPTIQQNSRNSKPAIWFNGDGYFTITGGFGLDAQPFWVVFAAKATQDDADEEDIWTGRQASLDRPFMTKAPAAPAGWYIYGGDGASGPQRYSFSTDTNWHVHVGVFDGASSRAWFDGTVAETDPLNLGTDGLPDGVTIGIDLQATSKLWHGLVGDIAFLAGDPSTATRQFFEGYEAHKYGTHRQLASGHPYRNGPPVTPMIAAVTAGVGIAVTDAESTLDARSHTAATNVDAAVTAADGELALNARSHVAGVGYAVAATDGEVALNATSETVTAGTGVAASAGTVSLDARAHPVAAGASLAVSDGEMALGAVSHVAGVGYAVATDEGTFALNTTAQTLGSGVGIVADDAGAALNVATHPVSASVGVSGIVGDVGLNARTHSVIGAASDSIAAIRGDVALNASANLLAGGAGVVAAAGGTVLAATAHATGAGVSLAAAAGTATLGQTAHPLSVGTLLAATAGDLGLAQRVHALAAATAVLAGAGMVALDTRSHTVATVGAVGGAIQGTLRVLPAIEGSLRLRPAIDASLGIVAAIGGRLEVRA